VRSRKKYIEKTYSKYWITARKNIYGFMDYDKSLLDFITKKCDVKQHAKILEVGVGTGYPFADFLSKSGYSVYGIDLSPELIGECNKINPNIHCKVGDAEQLDYPDDKFDFVYCVHSSWYFPNLYRAITEMIRVVRPGKGVMFDILNINNSAISKIYKNHVFENSNLLGMILKTFKNTVKFVMRRGVQDWPFIVFQTPSRPESIVDHLRSLNVADYRIMIRDGDSIKCNNGQGYSFLQYDRLIFYVCK